MNAWLHAAAALLLVMVPCGWVCLRGTLMERLIGLQLAQIVAVLVLLMLAAGYDRGIYVDLALSLAVLSLASGLVFIRFLERWL